MMAMVVTLSMIVQWIAAGLAVQSAWRKRRRAWVFLALGFFLIGLRHGYLAFRILLGDGQGDAGNELVFLIIAVLVVMGVSGLHPAKRSGKSAHPDASTQKAAVPKPQYLAHTAVLLGIMALLGSAVVGYYSYRASRDTILENVYASNLGLARMLGSQVSVPPDSAGRALVLADLEVVWNRTEKMFESSFLCVVDRSGHLRLHTARPGKVGQFVGNIPLSAHDQDSVFTIGTLARARQDFVGEHVTLSGERQVTAFAYSPALDGLVSIHVSRGELEGSILTSALPWAAGLGFVTVLFLPLSLLILHRGYSSSQKTADLAMSALQKSEEQFRSVVENMPVMVDALDENDNIVIWNRECERVTGYQAEEVVGNPAALDRLYPEDGFRERKLRDGADPGDGLRDLPWQVTCKDGSIRHVAWSNLAGRFPIAEWASWGVGVDVTEQTRAEAALKRYANRLEVLHEIDQAVLAATSVEDFCQAALRRIRTLVDCTRASVMEINMETREATLLAVDADSPLILSPGERVHVDVPGLVESSIADGFRIVDVDAGSAGEYLQGLADRHIQAFLVVPLVSQGTTVGSLNLGAEDRSAFTDDFIEIAREVAAVLAIALEKTRLHEQVQNHAAELEDRVAERTALLAETNADLEGFVYTVTHDLRAPLRAIAGFGHALLDDFGKRMGPGGRGYAERILQAAGHMDTLISDVLEYSRLNWADLQLNLASLEEVVGTAVEQLESEIDRCGACVDIEHPLPAARCHRSTLVQVFANLLGNALKFVDEDVTPRVCVRSESADEVIRVWVEDNGIGIPAEHHDRIFGLFERLHGIETYAGTGVGLALVRKAVERMGSKVGVESSPGNGSRFWVEMPKLEN